MNRFIKHLCTLIFICFLFLECKKNDSVTPDIPETPQLVTTTIKIMVVNEDGMIMTNAKVQCGNTIAYTDDFGLAVFKNVTVPTNKALVKVNVDGYFEGYRTFAASERESFGKIKLQRYQMSGIVQATSGGSVDIGSEVNITFPANAFVKEDGSAYTGIVSVNAHYLNPEAEDFSISMPGDLVAEDNGDALLKSYGMMNVELKSDMGLPVKLKPGAKATITALIPSTLLSMAPATIPMWYFDTTEGIWIKEGQGTKQGNSYVGEVSHFTFWNYDYAYPRVTIYGRLVNAAGSPVVNTEVILRVPSIDVVLSSYTNNDGYFSTPAPLNQNCELTFYSLSCNLALHTINVTTGSVDKNAGTIIVNTTSPFQYNVSGNFLDCNNVNIQNGSLKLFTQNHLFETTISNGQAALPFSFCKDSIDVILIAEDNATGKNSIFNRRLYKNVPANLGTQNVCASSASGPFMRLIVDGQMYYIQGNQSTDSMNVYHFNFTNHWAQISCHDFTNPGSLITKVVINSDVNLGACRVTHFKFIEYPGLSPLGALIELNNYFLPYTSTPGELLKGRTTGRIFDSNINQWRYIDVVYSARNM